MTINKNDGEILLNYITYNEETGKINISINEYEYPKSEFNVDTELDECISTINRLYNKCNDDRITYDTFADEEYYTREAIQYVPQKELLLLNRRLEYVKGTDEELKVKHQIEIVEDIVKQIDDILN